MNLKWFTAIFFLLTSLNPLLHAAPSLVTTIRGYEPMAAFFCEQIKAHGPCHLLKEETFEFENSNTFVRFQEEVFNRDVYVLVPSWVSPFSKPDLFMEALLKVRTARSLGAKRVIAVLRGRVQHFDWLQIAGFTHLTGLSIANARQLNNKEVATGRLAATVDFSLSSQPLTIQTLSDLQKSNYRRSDLKLEQPLAYLYTETHSSLAANISAYTNIPVVFHPDEVLQPGAEIFFLASTTNDNVNESFFKALHRMSELRDAGHKVHFITPYFPYARSDKIDQSGITISGRLIADLIEKAGAESVVFTRAHTPQVQGFFSGTLPTFNLSGRESINETLRKLNVEMIVSPDQGFVKDATYYASDLKIPLAVINKRRDPITSEIKTYGISGDAVAGKNVAIVDDETATGGTLASAAQILKEQHAASVVAVVTHLAGTAKKALNSSDIDKLIITDTLLNYRNISSAKLARVSVAKEISQIILKLKSNVPDCAQLLNQFSKTVVR